MHFTTPRLSLQPLGTRDAAELFHIRSDARVMQYWDWPADSSPALTLQIVDILLEQVRLGEALYWTLRLRSDNSLAGLCDLGGLQNQGSADIGFMLASAKWGQGLAKEVLQALTEFAVLQNLHTLMARIHSANTRCARLLLSAGFQPTASVADFEIRPGVFRHCRYFRYHLNAGKSVRI